jgi:thiol-disulfide isomerase/thioredoxin
MLVVSVVLLWIVVIALSILVIVLYRQFGLIYIGSRARIEQTGLPVGRRAPEAVPLQVEGRSVAWSWHTDGALRGTVALMSTAECELCAELLPRLNQVADKWRGVFRFLVVDRVMGDGNSPVRELPDPRSWAYALDAEAAMHESLDVEATPFVFVLDHSGKVLAKGIVNLPESIDAMVQGAVNPDELRDQPPAGNQPSGGG